MSSNRIAAYTVSRTLLPVAGSADIVSAKATTEPIGTARVCSTAVLAVAVPTLKAANLTRVSGRPSANLLSLGGL